MTDVHKTMKRVESSTSYKKFKENNKSAYLVHAFCHIKDASRSLEVGYYDKSTDKITVFSGDPVAASPPEDVFKESGVLEKLDIAAVKIGLEDVNKIAEDIRAEKYEKHPVMQVICILQQSGKPVWNLTLVLQTLNMLNLKIDASTGALISEDIKNIMDLRSKE